MNIRNNGVVIGRLTKDPVVFTNKDGSKKVMVNVAAQDNFRNSKGERASQFVPLEAFVSNKQKGLGPYDYMNKGDLVGLEYTVRTNNYEDKNGQMVYDFVLFIQSVDLMETKKSADARKAQAQTATAQEQEDIPFED